jgi:SH3 domain protein
VAIAWGGLVCGIALASGAAARAEPHWVQGAPIELRSGGSLGYRVVGVLGPGERVEVLQQGNGWAEVRTSSGKEGWLVSEHLSPVAPPLERVNQLEQEAARMRVELAAASTESARLRETASELEARDGERTSELDRLLRENARLAAGERWSEWLTGAGILGVGMTLGALLRGWAGGRRASRIRL